MSAEGYFASYFNDKSNFQTLEGVVIDIGRQVSKLEKEAKGAPRGERVDRALMLGQLPVINQRVSELTGWPLREVPEVFVTDPMNYFLREIWANQTTSWAINAATYEFENTFVGQVADKVGDLTRATRELFSGYIPDNIGSRALHCLERVFPQVRFDKRDIGDLIQKIGERGSALLAQVAHHEIGQQFSETWIRYLPLDIYLGQYTNNGNGILGNEQMEVYALDETTLAFIFAHEVTHGYQPADIECLEVKEGQARWVQQQYAAERTQQTGNPHYLLNSLRSLGFDATKAYLNTRQEQGIAPLPEIARRDSFIPLLTAMHKTFGVDKRRDAHSIGTAWALIETTKNPSEGFEAIRRDPTHRPPTFLNANPNRWGPAPYFKRRPFPRP